MPCRSGANSMGKLEGDLEGLVAATRGSGFGDPDALQQHLEK